MARTEVVLVDAQGLAARRPDRVLFSELSLTVRAGDRVGVVGTNGCGKSTLLRTLAGVVPAEQGVVRWGRDVRVALLDQDAPLPAGTVRQVVGGSWEGEALLDRLGMGEQLDADTATLSGGQARRVALARTLVTGADLLLLDEPTNHLDLDAVAWLEEHLAAFRGGLVLVTHDRHVLDRVTTRVLELDRGRAWVHEPSGEHAGSGYAAYLAARAEREERAAEAEQTRRILARKELAWLRRGAPARTRKPKARVEAATALVEARPQAAARPGELGLAMGSARLGSKGIELHGVAARAGGAAGGGPLVVEGVELLLGPGTRLGIVGSNGSGKSTLLDVIAGRAEPAAGRVERGSTVRVGYHDQRGAALDESARLREVVARARGGRDAEPTWEDARLAERFWFDRDAQWARVGTLSGGERRRLQLLVVLAAQPNVLLLDEPTNDLDLDTLRALEDFLDDWSGALVVVSHDRSFLDRTVEHVAAIEGGRLVAVRGGLAAWAAGRAAREREPARPRSPARPAATAAVAAGGRGAGPGRPGRRSPATLRKLLGETERSLARLDARRSELTEALGEAGRTGDHTLLARLGTELAVLDAEHRAAEDRWLELAAEAEA